ncbi:aspartate aminotransferase family protein [Catenulispora sp. NF23]|uniref:Aspartate aminotransferase family protein n=1 Tax=Catenulispora pinistramenti TaxID=2705254 RepID=A0ABS5KX37_9ACTN|nr:pyridoxal-dependent decarboxylase [Catenulispora pinistramenti]MBS2533949.1 aspartate aminotransferase family protein [Catenulispora pinistramenti]MBS2550570.1 aspartate aminotransferase family protein [Catenulispora pinistramenti]
MTAEPLTAPAHDLLSDYDSVLRRAYEHAVEYLRQQYAEDRLPVGPVGTDAQLRALLGGRLAAGGTPARDVVDELVRATAPGLVRSGRGRYFGYVTGGTLPAAMAADWLTSTWDQNTIVHDGSPATAVTEEVCEAWLVDLLGLDEHTSVAFTPSTTYAELLALTVARHSLLARHGWDVTARGLSGAPEINILINESVHPAVTRSLQVLGLSGQITALPSDDSGRMDVADVRAAVAARPGVPVLLCGHIGEINTGGVDRLRPLCDQIHAAGGWVHLDAAFGLWAAASPRLRAGLLDGVELADSIATDTHKWLNTPYDCGVAFIRDPDAHRQAFPLEASYLQLNPDERHPSALNIDISRRSRVFPLWAALRQLGRQGVADLVENTCARSRQLAEAMASEPGVTVLNQVHLNQVLLRFEHPGGDHDAHTERVAKRFQQDGSGWAATTSWKGTVALRFSMANWTTTADDIAETVRSLRSCHRQLRAGDPAAP